MMISPTADSEFPLVPALGRREWARKMGGEDEGFDEGGEVKAGPGKGGRARNVEGCDIVWVGVEARDLGEDGVEGHTEGAGDMKL